MGLNMKNEQELSKRQFYDLLEMVDKYLAQKDFEKARGILLLARAFIKNSKNLDESTLRRFKVDYIERTAGLHPPKRK